MHARADDDLFRIGEVLAQLGGGLGDSHCLFCLFWFLSLSGKMLFGDDVVIAQYSRD